MGYISLYAGPWDCYVDGEKVEPQPGDFYGGWVTSDIEGKVKGGPGTCELSFPFPYLSCFEGRRPFSPFWEMSLTLETSLEEKR